MADVLSLIGLLFVWVGVFFCTTSVIGLIRLPDVYTRLHAGSKVVTLGFFGLLAGVALLLPEAWPKALVLALFVTITSPVASHAMAAAAYRQRVPMTRVRDDLEGSARYQQIIPQETVEEAE